MAVSALTLVATVWSAADHADGHASTFWSYLGLSVNAFLVPSFAAACIFNWMDDSRRRPARWALFALLVLSGLAALAEAVFGGSSYNDRGANVMQDAAAMLMVAGGATLVLGLTPRRVNE